MKEKEKSSKKLDRLELNSKPTLIITERLKRQIDFLHRKVGTYEWSGELLTSEQGTITDLDKWKITAEDIFLVDIGSGAYTSYQVEEGAFKAVDIVELYEKFPDLLEGKLKNHHIHSHHTMDTFFSGTDWDNLEERACVSNYFIMLIVNFNGKYCAKVAFKSKVEGGISPKVVFFNNSDGFAPIELEDTKDKEVLTIMDCNIVFEVAKIEEDFEKRYDYVHSSVEEAKKKKAEEKSKQIPLYDDKNGYGSHWDNYEFKNGRWVPKETKIHNMTDKEFQKWEKNNEWERKHFHILVNAIIDERITGRFDSAIVRLEEMDRKLKTTIDLENFCAGFQASLREYFDKLFIGKDDDDYSNLMYLGLDILEPYTENNKLTDKIFEIVWDEAEEADKGYKSIGEDYATEKYSGDRTIFD